MLGFYSGFTATTALPEHGHALTCTLAVLLLATVCPAFLEANGDLPAIRFHGEDAWPALARVAPPFGLVFVTNRAAG